MFAGVRAGHEISAQLSFPPCAVPVTICPRERRPRSPEVNVESVRNKGGIDDFFDSTDPANRVQPFEEGMSFGLCIRVSITPGALVFNRVC